MRSLNKSRKPSLYASQGDQQPIHFLDVIKPQKIFHDIGTHFDAVLPRGELSAFVDERGLHRALLNLQTKMQQAGLLPRFELETDIRNLLVRSAESEMLLWGFFVSTARQLYEASKALASLRKKICEKDLKKREPWSWVEFDQQLRRLINGQRKLWLLVCSHSFGLLLGNKALDEPFEFAIHVSSSRIQQIPYSCTY